MRRGSREEEEEKEWGEEDEEAGRAGQTRRVILSRQEREKQRKKGRAGKHGPWKRRNKQSGPAHSVAAPSPTCGPQIWAQSPFPLRVTAGPRPPPLPHLLTPHRPPHLALPPTSHASEAGPQEFSSFPICSPLTLRELSLPAH